MPKKMTTTVHFLEKNTKQNKKVHITEGGKQKRDYLNPPVCSPSRSCCPAPQRENSPGLEGWPGSRTRPSSCLESWRCWALSRQTPGRSSPLRGRTLRLRTGTSPDLLCPKSETQKREEEEREEWCIRDDTLCSQAPNNLITVNKEIKVILWLWCYMVHIKQISLITCVYTVVESEVMCGTIRETCKKWRDIVGVCNW